MIKISAEMIRRLREETGATMAECKSALVYSEGDLEAAISLLQARKTPTDNKLENSENTAPKRREISDNEILKGGDNWQVFREMEKDFYSVLAANNPDAVSKEEVWYAEFYEDMDQIRFYERDDLLRYCRHRILTGDRAVLELGSKFHGEYMGSDQEWYGYLK